MSDFNSMLCNNPCIDTASAHGSLHLDQAKAIALMLYTVLNNYQTAKDIDSHGAALASRVMVDCNSNFATAWCLPRKSLVNNGSHCVV